MADKQTNKQTNKDESGRTMIEMLGTLAIIGVLSIGGVTGYGRAIKTYRTNSAIETAQRQAAIVAGDIGLGQAVNPGSATVIKAPSGYEVAVKDAAGSETNVTTTTPYFGVEVGGEGGTALQSEVAKEMLERAIGEWKNVHAFGVKDSGGTIHWLNSTGSGTNGFEGVVGDAKTVIIIVVYASDLSLRSTDNLNIDGFDVTPGGDEGGDENPVCDPECTGDMVCNNGTCECPDGTYLMPETNTCEEVTGECTKNSDCNEWCSNQPGAVACACNVTVSGSSCGNTCRYDSIYGICVAITEAEKQSGHSNNKEFSWWGTKNFCLAIGKQMPSRADVCDGNACDDLQSWYWLKDSCEGCDSACRAFFVTNETLYETWDNPFNCMLKMTRMYAVCK